MDLFNQPRVTKACISKCGMYRYWLTRHWDFEKPPTVFVMLNPSTADADNDDPTIRRCIGYAKAWGAGGIVVVNLFAFRATDPNELKRADDPIGPDNDYHIQQKARCRPDGLRDDGRRVIAAWGCDGALRGRDRAVASLLAGRVIECLGVTKDGHPKHPLYLRSDATPIPFVVRKAVT
jgi:hypothetical protein